MIKRMIDMLGALLGIVLLFPVFLAVALAVYVSMGRPIFFRQLRPGRHHRPFTMVKFRTMTAARDTGGALLDDGARLTKVGRFLRSSSLDELPELWNVLVGDMSLVGPRPLLMVYLGRYTPEQDRRHSVRPGVTGWAQINGRNAISWDEKFALDIWYLDHQSIGLDLNILALTVLHVFRRADINSLDAATMPEFVGTRDE